MKGKKSTSIDGIPEDTETVDTASKLTYLSLLWVDGKDERLKATVGRIETDMVGAGTFKIKSANEVEAVG